MNRIREYITNNPAKWEMDTLNVGADLRVRLVPPHPPDMEIRELQTAYATEAWMV